MRIATYLSLIFLVRCSVDGTDILVDEMATMDVIETTYSSEQLVEEKRLVLSWLRDLRIKQRVNPNRMMARLKDTRTSNIVGFTSTRLLEDFIADFVKVRNIDLREMRWVRVFGSRPSGFPLVTIMRIQRVAKTGTGRRFTQEQFNKYIDLVLEGS
jgi:hypothetical protein